MSANNVDPMELYKALDWIEEHGIILTGKASEGKYYYTVCNPATHIPQFMSQDTDLVIAVNELKRRIDIWAKGQNSAHERKMAFALRLIGGDVGIDIDA